MRRRTRLLATLISVCAALISLGLTPVQASAAAYDGTDPTSTGCGNTAVTEKQVNVGPYGAYVQLRYSTACRTTWAKLFNGNAGSPGDCAASYAIIHRNSDGREYKAVWGSGDSGSIHTLQLNDAGVTSYAIGDVDYCFAGPYRASTGSF
jgi:hypothetical protein